MTYYPCQLENQNKRDWFCVYQDTVSTLSTTSSKAYEIMGANSEMPFYEDISEPFHVKVKALWSL